MVDEFFIHKKLASYIEIQFIGEEICNANFEFKNKIILRIYIVTIVHLKVKNDIHSTFVHFRI